MPSSTDPRRHSDDRVCLKIANSLNEAYILKKPAISRWFSGGAKRTSFF